MVQTSMAMLRRQALQGWSFSGSFDVNCSMALRSCSRYETFGHLMENQTLRNHSADVQLTQAVEMFQKRWRQLWQALKNLDEATKRSDLIGIDSPVRSSQE
jgi:hypothetical protein